MSVRRKRGFTLIELLVVIAIIAILASILFPVFASARDRARGAACMSNMKQLGTGILMYLQDNDEHLFFRAAKTAAQTRTNQAAGATVPNELNWWNQLMPYLKTSGVYKCPSDGQPSTTSLDVSGNIIPRSYVVSNAVEYLNASQITQASQAIVVSEKWGTDLSVPAKANNESWFEAFDGDMNPDVNDPVNRPMCKFANRHQGGMECAFFDGHAKWLKPEVITNSPLLSGCAYITAYPTDGMCDAFSSPPGGPCATGSHAFSGPGNPASGDKPNLCNNPAFNPALPGYPQP